MILMDRKILSKILISITVISVITSLSIVVSQNLNIGQNKKIKVLLVAGHEPNAGGAYEFKPIKERDLTLQLSELLKEKLSINKDMEVIVARDKNGWNTELENYVKTNETSIMNWARDMKEKMLAKVEKGEFKLINPGLKHNPATSSAVLFLFGTNKWIEEKDIDVVFHIHFNDNPKYKGKPNYSGYCMYVPEKQFVNASSSLIFANYLNEEISKIQTKSTMPQEKDLIIETQELIAVGSYGTLKIPSVVVEYAYMYETKMLASSTRNKFIETAASSTAKAIEKYVNEILILHTK